MLQPFEYICRYEDISERSVVMTSKIMANAAECSII